MFFILLWYVERVHKSLKRLRSFRPILSNYSHGRRHYDCVFREALGYNCITSNRAVIAYLYRTNHFGAR